MSKRFLQDSPKRKVTILTLKLTRYMPQSNLTL